VSRTVQADLSLVGGKPPATGWSRARWRLLAGTTVLFAVIASANLGGSVVQALVWRAPGIDKLLHWAEYAGVFAILHAIVGGDVEARPRAWAAAIATLAIGFLDETLQGFFAARTVDFGDLAMNASGVASGLLWVRLDGHRLRAAAAAVPLLASVALAAYEHHRFFDYYAGLRFDRARRYVEARDHYRLALAAGLDSPSLLNSLAWAEVESGSGDIAAATRYAARALAAEPENADILDTYGWALHASGRSADALPYLERAYAKRPTMYCINLHLGVVLHALGRDAAAARFLRTQIAGRPGSPEAAAAQEVLAHLAQPRVTTR
jgi:tetratricopeptide (TPR) repeat protein